VATCNGRTITTEHRIDRPTWRIIPSCGIRPSTGACAGHTAQGDSARPIVVGVCSGAYVLGAADLLDGRDCTTHYRYVKDLASQFLVARVNPDVLYVVGRPGSHQRRIRRQSRPLPTPDSPGLRQ
jgi:AraC family transcriptional regulator, transcriptional activator FtrA